MSRPVISWSVVALLAAAVTVLQIVASPAIGILLLVIQLAILLGLGFFAYSVWRNNRSRLQWLSRGQKALFYGAGALIVLVVVGSFLVRWTLFSALGFFVVIGACGYVMWRLWRETDGWY